MGLARLIVIEGPDLGAEFDIPMRGGGIGRDPRGVVRLSDPSVSRAHCAVEFRNGALFLIDSGSRNRTLVNGAAISVHRFEAGDVVAVGSTRLAYVPTAEAEAEAAAANRGRPSAHGRVTAELRSRELWQMRLPDALAQGPEARARRQLAALAHLGDELRHLDDRAQLDRVACAAVRDALAAERAYLLVPDGAGRLQVRAVAGVGADAQRPAPALAHSFLDKVVREGKAVALEDGGVAAVAAPLFGAGHEAPVALVYAERGEAGRASFDTVDILALGCVAHVVSAAQVSFDARAALAVENRELSEQLGGRAFVGSSPAAETVLRFVSKVGPSEATVLLTGESGSGKEMVARAIHDASRRASAPFIAINCAALTETLIESELFGHERGAFTGASERKAGRFELADKGTLFLDEVGELPLSCQTKFLRVLEEQVFERVGGGRTIAVDVRVVAATNRDLPSMVRQGRFREDLYYRLSVIHTVVPPLRARTSDIPVLAEHFLARFRKQVARRVAGFSPEALAALTRHPWPGNVRELRNAVERAVVLGEGPWILPAHLPPDVLAAGAAPPPPAGLVSAPALPVDPAAAGPGASIGGGELGANAAPGWGEGVSEGGPGAAGAAGARPLRELEREGIIAALQATGGNKVQAAALLQIDRSTLYKKLKDYDISL
ncbi:sigma-54-dependent Fis family transcriptional regulator [Haliangium ochraceum]|uniref:Sigma54 specific transcriptional regulator, Fis family n=1 Tax=Haliangium ochraceum (strain DSM 14365 / JCM 11303 / SMP-2) TaxID=502025 RepID=D0LQ47_HALO1|nr:sigma-54-dependent Fis family transcriptional regulator [Haliangium ochraceum]ACY17084.1 sigma54 specific transcriptional regulator, Fis family [Haliangium ochraceum DSM 14365]